MPSASAVSSDSGGVVVDPLSGGATTNAAPERKESGREQRASTSVPTTPGGPSTPTAAPSTASNKSGNGTGRREDRGRRDSAALGGEGAANVHQRSLQIASMGMYDLGDTLGKGEYSVVRVATHRLTRSRLAMKMLDKERLEEKALQMFFREVQIMKHLRHPNVIRMFEVFDTRRELCLVLEVAGKGDVLDYILQQSNKRLTEEESRRLFHQMLLAVDYCHRKRIFHRDLKAENFLLDDDFNIKLSDFGFANRALPGETLKTFCGSPPYAAPEIHGKQEYNGRCADMWSMGVLLYVLVSGKFPFQGKDMKDAIMNARYRTLWHVSEACRDIIRGLLIVRPSRRMTLPEVMESPWMKEGGFASPTERDRAVRGSSVSLDIDGRMIVSVPVLDELEGLGYARDEVVRSLQDNLFGPVSAMYNLVLNERPSGDETISVPFKTKGMDASDLKTVAEHGVRASTSTSALPATRPTARDGSAAQSNSNNNSNSKESNGEATEPPWDVPHSMVASKPQAIIDNNRAPGSAPGKSSFCTLL